MDGIIVDKHGVVVSFYTEILRNRWMISLSLLLICFGIGATIFGSNKGIALVVAGGVGMIIIGLIISRPLAKAVLDYLDRNEFR